MKVDDVLSAFSGENINCAVGVDEIPDTAGTFFRVSLSGREHIYIPKGFRVFSVSLLPKSVRLLVRVIEVD